MLELLAASLVQPAFSSVVKCISGRVVTIVGRGYMNKNFTPSCKGHRDYFNYEPRFYGFFSRKSLPRIKDGAYVINLDDENSKVTHSASLFIDRNKSLYFYSFELNISQELLNKIRNKSITHNIFRIQNNESIMCGFYCITFTQ